MIKKLIFGFLVLLALVMVYFVYGYYGIVDLGSEKVSIIITEGDSFAGVARRLLEGGVVRSGLMLTIPARLREIDRALTPGRYDFSGKNSCRSILDRLERADYLRVRVTVPEGAPIWRVASILAHQMEIDSAAVTALNTEATYLNSLNLPFLEGHLFPQTYFFPWGTDPQEMLADMVAMFHSQADSLLRLPAPNGLSRMELLVLASIVEAEALVDDEKPIIASVYHNRLRTQMKLDADPTVIYGLGGLNRPLNKRDLRLSSPYNTYLKRGLPPTPINSPGLAAIRAALYPDSTDYFYFVADGTGRHRFSRTNAEHNRARHETMQTRQRQQTK